MSAEDTHGRILDATVTAMGRHGLSRLSLEDVAGEAGVSRQTVYRYFGGRDALISAAIVREEEIFIASMLAAAAGHRDFRPALEAAITVALRLPREHPLLDRILATEPEALLPFLTTGAGPVLSAAQPVIESLLAQWAPHLTDYQLSLIAEASTRLLVSYAINPPSDPVETVAAGLADFITHGIKST